MTSRATQGRLLDAANRDMTELTQLTDDQIQELPIDRLALPVRKHCDESGELEHAQLPQQRQPPRRRAGGAHVSSEAMNLQE